MKNYDIIDSIAGERIAILERLAEKSEDKRLALRYSRLLKMISTHYKIKLPRPLKSRFCRGCGQLLFPGKNCKVRLVSSKGYVLYLCEGCKKENRIPYRYSHPKR